jgi:hypothetical protein
MSPISVAPRIGVMAADNEDHEAPRMMGQFRAPLCWFGVADATEQLCCVKFSASRTAD